MANGVYGTMIPTMLDEASIGNYVDIFYSYSATRNSADAGNSMFEKVEKAGDMLSPARSNVTGEDFDTAVEGMYNLQLPAGIFGRKGYYTIYIKPKEVPITITDVSTLKDFPGVRGVVLDTSKLPDEVRNDALRNNGLVGYRLVLKSDTSSSDKSLRSSDIRIVTSNNKCQPVSTVSLTTNTKTYTYQYNDNATLTFLTITPSTPLSFKASSTPYIGKATQAAYLVNTLFEPVCIELEMVENDADTLAVMIGGSQLRDLNNGLITTFDKNNNIFMQHEMSTLKRTDTGTPQYEIRENKENDIDFTQTLIDKLQ